MDKFTPPIFKPANVAVQRSEVNDLASRIRAGVTGPAVTRQVTVNREAQGSVGQAAPKALVR